VFLKQANMVVHTLCKAIINYIPFYSFFMLFQVVLLILLLIQVIHSIVDAFRMMNQLTSNTT
jgi:hypothetical protein